MKVLVVADDDDERMLLAQAFVRHGYTTRTAADGVQALELAAAVLPDVVVMDIGLPGMNGFELARQLRALGVPYLVAVTGYRRLTEDGGFDEHHVKPVNAAELLAALGRARTAAISPGD